MKKLGLLLIFLFLIPFVVAEEYALVNSKDWHDVYSMLIYGRLKGIDVTYLIDEGQGLDVYNAFANTGIKNFLLLESKKTPVISNFRSKLKSVGKNVNLIGTDEENINLALGKKLAEEKKISNFVILEGSLGYNAVAIASYAVSTKSYVLFANKENVDEIYNFLKERATNVLLYGALDRKVKEKLISLNPEIINEGNKYNDNIAIVKKFIQNNPTKQIILTNGEFIETGLIDGSYPVILIGTSNVPIQILDFLKSANIQSVLVIGYDLFTNAKRIKNEAGIKRMVLKYGQATGDDIHAIPIYPIPSYIPNMNIGEIRYNTLSKQLEVIYKNTGVLFTYFQAFSHTIKADGKIVAQIGDEVATFLNTQETKALTYDVDLTAYVDKSLTSESSVAYGDYPTSLERLIKEEKPIKLVSLDDASTIDIKEATYNKNKKRFEVGVENTGTEDVYVSLEIKDLLLNQINKSLSSKTEKIAAKATYTFKVEGELEEEDLQDNLKIKVVAHYGAVEDLLLKKLEKEVEVIFKEGTLNYLPLIVIILVILALIIIIKKKKRRHPF